MAEPLTGSLARLNGLRDSLRDAERRAADLITDRPHDVVHLSISALAERCSVSEATIFRLCRRLGYSGYQAFKIALARDLVEPIAGIHEAVSEADSPFSVAQKVFQTSLKALSETQSLLSQSTLDATVRALAGARKVEFYGVGGSGAVAIDAMHKFMRTGLACVAHTDSNLQIMGAALLQAGDVAVGISHSGSTKDVVEALQVAREAGATTVAITAQMSSPLVKAANLALFTTAGEEGLYSVATAARLAQLALVDCLFVAVSLARKEAALNSVERIREAIALKRY